MIVEESLERSHISIKINYLSLHSYEKKVIHLKQNGSRSLGFNIRGGEL